MQDLPFFTQNSKDEHLHFCTSLLHRRLEGLSVMHWTLLGRHAASWIMCTLMLKRWNPTQFLPCGLGSAGTLALSCLAACCRNLISHADNVSEEYYATGCQHFTYKETFSYRVTPELLVSVIAFL